LYDQPSETLCVARLCFKGRWLMRSDIVVGGKFPDIALPDTTGEIVKLSDLTRGADPIALVFYRGWW